MYKGYGNRLKEIRTIMKFSQAKMGELIGIEQHKLRDIEAERLQLSPDVADLLQEKFRINGWWLLTGKGSMFLDDGSSDNITQNISGSSQIVANQVVGKGNIVVSTHPKPVEPPAPPPPPPVSSYDDDMKAVISLLVYAPPAFLTALREKLEKFRDMSSM